MSFSDACSWSTASSAIVVAARVNFGDSASASFFLRIGDAFSSPKPTYRSINVRERDNTINAISDKSEQYTIMCLTLQELQLIFLLKFFVKLLLFGINLNARITRFFLNRNQFNLSCFQTISGTIINHIITVQWKCTLGFFCAGFFLIQPILSEVFFLLHK